MATIRQLKQDMEEQTVALEFVTNGFNRKKLDEVMGRTVGHILDRPHVREMVEEMSRQQLGARRATSAFVLNELCTIAGVKIGDFLDENGEVNIMSIMGHVGSAIAEYSTSEVEQDGRITTRRRIKLHDKLRALELLGRHLAMYTDKVQVDGLDTLAEEMKAARVRAEQHGK